MATEEATDRQSWYGAEEAVDRARGRAFELACLGATSFGILMVFVLLLYVVNDALRPFTAEPAWFLVYSLTLVLPVGATLFYLDRRAPAATWIGTMATAVPLFGALLGAGLLILFLHLFDVVGWFASAVAVAVAAAVVVGHERARPTAGTVERGMVLLAALALLPVVYYGVAFAPVFPAAWLIYLLTVALPAGALAGAAVYRRRERLEPAAVVGGAIVGGAAVGGLAAPLIGVGAWIWVVVFTAIATPTALFVESAARDRAKRLGLVVPVVAFGGALLGAAVVDTFAITSPDAWLDYQFLTAADSSAASEAGIYPALVGSVLMMIVVAAASFPIGVGAALYLEEYAPDGGPLGRIVTLIEINIGNLAGVPSVVYGLLGLALFIHYVGFGAGTVVVGGMTVGLLILPIVIISAQEAIRAVPDSMRQASYGMGATRWQTVRNVVLPEALPGILTGTILAFGRAIGETAPLLMIGAASTVFNPPNGFFDRFSAMPRQIFSWVGQPSDEFQYGVMAAGVVTLLVALLSMNAAAILIRNKYQRRS